VLVADEPTSALDVSVQAQVLAVLRKLRTEEEMAIVMITHDLNVVRSLADRVCVLYRGRVLEAGATEVVMEHPRHPYTRLLIDSRPGVSGHLPVVNAETDTHPCVYAGRCPLRDDDCLGLSYTRTSQTTSEHRAACVHPLSQSDEPTTTSGRSGQPDVPSTAGPGAVGRHSAPQEGTK
jgi:oligopeptide/dipeptide ABC transporter ATP-binding protein